MTSPLLIAVLFIAAPERTATAPSVITIAGPESLVVTRSVDQQSLFLSLRRMRPTVPAQINHQLRDQATATWTALPHDTAMVRLTWTERVISYSAQRRAETWTLSVDLEAHGVALKEHVRARLPRSIPASFQSPELKAAEAALREGRLGEARDRFLPLEDDYTLRGWAKLRAADIALLSDDTDAACASYAATAESERERTVGIIARLRQHIARCPQPRPDIQEALTRVRATDGAVRDFLANEVVWWLVHATHYDEVQAVLAGWPEQTATRAAWDERSLREALVARAVRLAPDAFSVARQHVRLAAEVAASSESDELRLTTARALITLGLSRRALELLQPLAARGRAGPGRETATAAALLLSIRAHELAGDTRHAALGAAEYRRRYNESLPEDADETRARSNNGAELSPELAGVLADFDKRIDALTVAAVRVAAAGAGARVAKP